MIHLKIPKITSLILVVMFLLNHPHLALANVLTTKDARSVSMTQADLVSVGQLIRSKADTASSVSTHNIDYEYMSCLLEFEIYDDKVFDGISELSRLVFVSSAMKNPEDEAVSLQSVAMKSRLLQTILNSTESEIDNTISRCQIFSDIEPTGLRLSSAIKDSSIIVKSISDKLMYINIREGNESDR